MIGLKPAPVSVQTLCVCIYSAVERVLLFLWVGRYVDVRTLVVTCYLPLN